MWKLIRKTDQWLTHELPLLVILLMVLVLRWPNLFEPYWYGDEGIYLTLGNALRHGVKLYAQIVDHKTPLIYYLATIGDQLWWRVFFMTWSLLTVTVFYHLAWKVTKNWLTSALSTISLVFLTCLPAFEGNIPNGELLVMGLVLIAALLLAHTQAWTEIDSHSSIPE